MAARAAIVPAKVVADMLVGEGLNRADVLAVIDSLIDAGLELDQPDTGTVLSQPEVGVLRAQLTETPAEAAARRWKDTQAKEA